MLKKRNRLKSPGLFKRTLSARRIGACDCFVVYALEKTRSDPPAAESRPPRFGFIVSKKIHKRSVRRNRIKRRLREIVRTRLLNVSPGPASRYQAVVIVARAASLMASYEEMQKKLLRCFL